MNYFRDILVVYLFSLVLSKPLKDTECQLPEAYQKECARASDPLLCTILKLYKPFLCQVDSEKQLKLSTAKPDCQVFFEKRQRLKSEWETMFEQDPKDVIDQRTLERAESTLLSKENCEDMCSEQKDVCNLLSYIVRRDTKDSGMNGEEKPGKAAADVVGDGKSAESSRKNSFNGQKPQEKVSVGKEFNKDKIVPESQDPEKSNKETDASLNKNNALEMFPKSDSLTSNNEDQGTENKNDQIDDLLLTKVEDPLDRGKGDDQIESGGTDVEKEEEDLTKNVQGQNQPVREFQGPEDKPSPTGNKTNTPDGSSRLDNEPKPENHGLLNDEPKITDEEESKITEEREPKITEEREPKITEEKDPKITEEREPKITEEKEPKITEEKEPKITEEREPKITEEGESNPKPEVPEGESNSKKEPETVDESLGNQKHNISEIPSQSGQEQEDPNQDNQLEEKQEPSHVIATQKDSLITEQNFPTPGKPVIPEAKEENKEVVDEENPDLFKEPDNSGTGKQENEPESSLKGPSEMSSENDGPFQDNDMFEEVNDEERPSGADSPKQDNDFEDEVDPPKAVGDSQQSMSNLKSKDEAHVYSKTMSVASPPESHFLFYFFTVAVVCVFGYLVFHNKKKIIALVIEGRSNGNGRRRRPSTNGYKRLDDGSRSF